MSQATLNHPSLDDAAPDFDLDPDADLSTITPSQYWLLNCQGLVAGRPSSGRSVS